MKLKCKYQCFYLIIFFHLFSAKHNLYNYALGLSLFCSKIYLLFLPKLPKILIPIAPLISYRTAGIICEAQFLRTIVWFCVVCHAKSGPPYLVLPGPNISKYLDPPDNILKSSSGYCRVLVVSKYL